MRSKQFGTVWKIIEEKEMWIEEPVHSGSAHDIAGIMPAIYVRYWHEDTSPGPGRGRTMYYLYSQQDPTFHDHWEILYDW